jgi:8-oxo-dGTP diphosphatase
MDVELAVNVVVLAGRHSARQVLLVRRLGEPYPGLWSLPGGQPQEREPFSLAARRELKALAGLEVPALQPPFGAYDEPDGFAPEWTVSVAFLLALREPVPVTGTRVEVAWRPALEARRSPKGVAFEHQLIIGDAVALLGRH